MSKKNRCLLLTESYVVCDPCTVLPPIFLLFSLTAICTCILLQGKKFNFFSGSAKVQWPVPEPNSFGCYRQLNSSSLHKQTRRNPLGGDVRSPVENHDLVPSLPDNPKSQTHSRMSECDGRPIQVKPNPVNRMVTASAGVQTVLSKWFTPCVDLFATHLTEPLYVSPVPDQNAYDIDALNINWMFLTAYRVASKMRFPRDRALIRLQMRIFLESAVTKLYENA